MELCLPFEQRLWPLPYLVLIFIDPEDIVWRAEENCGVLRKAMGRLWGGKVSLFG